MFAALVARIRLHRLALTRRGISATSIRLAQFALRRCLYLSNEMHRGVRRAPEASAMTARSIIESALVGSYLALHQGADAELLKKQARPAKRLRDRLLKGDPLAALASLSDVDFIAGPLDPALASVTSAPDLAQISAWLDQRKPFAPGLATLLYEETYGVLSNQVEHPTPQALERYGGRVIRPSLRASWWYRPTRLVPSQSLEHTVLPAISGLAASLARALGQRPGIFDYWVTEAESADGYGWSGSPARTAAARELVRNVGLTPFQANSAGFVIRMLGLGDRMRAASEAEQLLAACEVIDRARWPLRLVASCFASTRRLAIQIRGAGRAAALIHDADLAEDDQTLLAALALVYANVWPDDPASVSDALGRVAQTAETNPDEALDFIAADQQMPSFRGWLRRFRQQIDSLP